MTMIKTALATACAIGVLYAGTAAAEVRNQTLRFAFQNVKEHPQGQGAQKFADLVKEKSEGKIKVRLFPGGTLGGDLQTVSAIQGGTLDLTVLNAGILSAQVKDFAILDFPFLLNDAQEAQQVMDGPVGQALASRLEGKGLHTLGYWDLGFRNITNSKKPIARWEDLQGLKIRVIQSPSYLETFSALGANPVPMPFPEVYTGLEQRTVDGQENPNTVILGSKFYEVQKYLSVTRHVYNPQSFIIGEKSWNKLNEDERKVITEAAAEAQAYQRMVSGQAQDSAYQTLKGHMAVNEITPEEMDRFREKTKPVIEKLAKDVDPALVKMLDDEIQKARKSR